jgi:hypothetical protein
MTSNIQRIGDLEIDQDLAFQQRAWTVQRIGWASIALLILAALLGLFGPGPLSNATAGAPGADLWLEYERFERFKAPTTLRVNVGPGAVRDGVVRITLDRAYLDQVQVEQVMPQPESVETGPDRFTYTFKLNDPAQPTAITFHLNPQAIGRLSGRVGLDGEQAIGFDQFVYP